MKDPAHNSTLLLPSSPWRRAFAVAVFLAMTMLEIQPAESQTYTVLHSFSTAQTDGAFPQAALIQTSDGTLYGTTSGGGVSGFGTIFQMATDGSGFRVLHSFVTDTTQDGAQPRAGLIQASDGLLYGTAYSGGLGEGGTVFRIAPDGSNYIVLLAFTGGSPDFGGVWPFAGVIQGSNGFLYGTLAAAGSFVCPVGCGTLFQMATDGSSYLTLHRFSGVDGSAPVAPLIHASDGNFYGTTRDGGGTSAGSGVVFQLTLSSPAPARR